MKILIVEDKAENLYMLEALLKGNGYEVVSAVNGKEALEKLRSEGADMIIADILMPVMDGFRLCQEVRADDTLKHIPFIFYTATYTDEKDEEYALKLGADKFLRKPLEPDEFMKILKGVIRDAEEAKFRPQESALGKTEETFELYSERLVKKLEKKMLDVEKEITERKRAEERVKHLNLVLRAIRKVNQLITQEKDTNRLLQGVCDTLIENRGYYNAWTVLLDDTGRPVATAEAGLGKDFLPIVERLKKGKMTDCVKKAEMQSEIVVTKDPSSTCTDCPLAKRYHCRAGFTARLEHDGKMYGLLTVSIPGDFVADEEEQSLFEEVVGDIAYALYNIELEKERKRAEEALQNSEKRYRTLFEDSKDPIFINTREGNLIDANQSFLDLFGYSREEMADLKIQDIYLNPDDRPELLKEIDQKGSLKDYEIQYKRKDGTVKDCFITDTVRRANDGSIIGYQGIIRDMTEHKKLEAQLTQAQKMEAIGTLAGGIAHDFNNILSAVIGYTEISLGQTEKGTLLQRNLGEVRKAGIRAKNLIQQILTFSRQADQEQKPIYIKLLAKEALKLLKASLPSTIEIRQRIQSNSTVLSDPTQIHQVLMNLCTNAGHAMREDGGILEVSLTDEELDADFTARQGEMTPGSYIKLAVSDTGHGMPPDLLEKIFDPYFTTKEVGEGTGMGLSVVHGIVKNCGGTITVYSELGEGTTFNVFLPIIETKIEPQIAAEKPLPTGTERILFVDDEETLVDIGRQMLESLGYEVVTRTSSIEALELFKAQPDNFDLIITDMTMPNMMGDKLARAVMGMRSDIPIILCTGYSARISEEEAKEMGIKAFVMKPLLIRDLTETVRRVLPNRK